MVRSAEMVDQNVTLPEPGQRGGTQRASVALQIGSHARISAEVAVTSGGLLAIGALVSSILLSTAVIVRVARPRKDGGGGKRKRERERLRRM